MDSVVVFSIFSISIVIAAVWRDSFIRSKNKWIKFSPLFLIGFFLLFIIGASFHFNHKRDDKLQQFDLLKLVASKIDTTLDSKEILATPSDIFTLKREDSLRHLIKQTDSVSDELLNIKDYFSMKNMFSNITPGLQDTINKTYENIQQKQKLLQKASLDHGFIYAGIANEDQWIQDNFINQTHPSYKIPQKGDVLKCIKPIFIREAEAKPSANKRGWVNQELKGILQIGRVITIKNIIHLPCDYIWIEF